MYRLHIDIPLGTDQAEAIELAHAFRNAISNGLMQFWTEDAKLLDEIQVRLGNDSDRQRSNYLDINENGHVSTKKSRL